MELKLTKDEAKEILERYVTSLFPTKTVECIDMASSYSSVFEFTIKEPPEKNEEA